MASLKKIGFFWGEDKITVVEFEKNTPVKVVSSPLPSKNNNLSPFNSTLTEEIQITAILQKMLQDNGISGGSFCISLPMKDIILRSFIIPFVKPDEMQNVIKFEAKKYMPFDIQDLSFVFHTIPFAEGQNKRLLVIFFATRKEVLSRYERIFKQVNSEVSCCEPYMISLSKILLFKKEIKPTDHLAFLSLDTNAGRICFIDHGMPQFIREFSIGSNVPSEEVDDSVETTNLKIINEVGNSFDFYARQFNGDRIEQMLILSDPAQSDLLSTLETELKVKLTKFSPVIKMSSGSQSNDMDAIYAMGACIAAPMESLSKLNFQGDRDSKDKVENELIEALTPYKEIGLVLLMCMFFLAGVYVFFQVQLSAVQKQFDRLALQEGAFVSEPIDTIQADIQQNTDKLAQYKTIRTKSDVAAILFMVSSHLPRGASLTALNINYDQADTTTVGHVIIDMAGQVFTEDPNEEIAVVNQVFSDFKNDKKLSLFIKSVNLVSLVRQEVNGQQVMGFNIHCS